MRFHVGGRTNKTLNKVLISLELANAKTVYTDKLKNYRYLIEKKVHNTTRYAKNHVERMHLNYRTHLKRLNRRSVCFSRSLLMRICVLKVYLWG